MQAEGGEVLVRIQFASVRAYVVVSTYAGEKEGWKKKAQVMEEKELRLLPAECT